MMIGRMGMSGLLEVKRVGGQLVNVEVETLGTAVKDPWKEFQKKK